MLRKRLEAADRRFRQSSMTNPWFVCGAEPRRAGSLSEVQSLGQPAFHAEGAEGLGGPSGPLARLGIAPAARKGAGKGQIAFGDEGQEAVLLGDPAGAFQIVDGG